MNSNLYRGIRAEVEAVRLIDTHEHLISEGTRVQQNVDLLDWFIHYASSDLVSSGLSQRTLLRVRDSERPVDERWAMIAPFWEHVRTTAYGRALLLAARDLFGIDDISEETYARLSKRISESNRTGWYRHVLKERAKIDLCILHPIEDLDPVPLRDIDRSLFAPVLVTDPFVEPANRVELEELERSVGLTIHTLEDWLEAIDVRFEQAVADGVVAIKVAVAYNRPLHFEKTSRADAERVFNRLSKYPVHQSSVGKITQVPPVSWAELKPLQDYLVHHTIRRAVESQLPIQIHTGLQEGSGNFLTNSNPLQLVNLLLEYGEARFDLFHAGYPYQSEMATLGKNFANVYVDLCWLHVISPWVARQALNEWIETVPSNKILGFGGDYIFVEGAYAHSRFARDNVAQVLSEKVASGYLGEDEALRLARRLLRENALELFDLPA